MPTLGIHASHEQLSPHDLLEVVRAAGGGRVPGRDVLRSPRAVERASGESGHAWAWLGAAMQATSLPFGVVTAPGQRYHPAVAAQAIATLGDLFPGRFWAALGSGEALNEHVTESHGPGRRIGTPGSSSAST